MADIPAIENDEHFVRGKIGNRFVVWDRLTEAVWTLSGEPWADELVIQQALLYRKTKGKA